MKNTIKVFGIIVLAAVIGFSLAACPTGGGGGGGGGSGTTITYTASPDGGTTTTAIKFTFSAAVSGLTADDITVTNGTGSVTKGALTGSGTSWSLAVTVNTAGNITVKINKSGIESGAKTVAVEGSVPKTVAITGLSSSYQYGNILLYPVGTSSSDVVKGISIVAGASHDNPDILSPSGSITYPLYSPGGTRWTGSGTYDVYWMYNPNSGSDPELYKASSVSFTSETTTLAFSQFTKVSIESSAYSLDGMWKNTEGMQITVNGNTGVYSVLGTGTSQHPMWHDAVSKGYIAIGKKFWQNLTNTSALTWSGQQLGVTFNSSNPNVATGTGWTNGTLTMSVDGQTLTGVYGDGTVTWTRVSTYPIDGVWEYIEGMRITVNGSTGVYTDLGTGTSQHPMWHDAVSKGYIAVGKQFMRNLTSTGALTWSGQELGVTYNPSNPNVATGTGWTNYTYTISADGQTLTNTGTSVTWTRKQ